MDRDTVIALAREAGLPYIYETGEVANLGLVERFAALVAANEREECAKVCDEQADKDNWEGYYANQCAAVIRSRA